MMLKSKKRTNRHPDRFFCCFFNSKKTAFQYLLTALGLACISPYSTASFAENIAIITSAENANQEITQTEAVNIFMGRYRQFADGKTAKPIDNIAAKNNFYTALVNKSPAEINAYWARLIFSGRTQPPEKASNSTETIDSVAKESYAISYIPVSQVDKNNHKIKVLLVLEAK